MQYKNPPASDKTQKRFKIGQLVLVQISSISSPRWKINVWKRWINSFLNECPLAVGKITQCHPTCVRVGGIWFPREVLVSVEEENKDTGLAKGEKEMESEEIT